MIESKISINSLARIQSAWKHAPHELLSLLDMIEFIAIKFFSGLEKLESQQAMAAEWIKEQGESCIAGGGHKTDLFKIVTRMEECCAPLEMSKSLSRLRQFKKRVSSPADLPLRVMESEIHSIKETIFEEFPDRFFVFVKPDKVKFIREPIFGDYVELVASTELNAEIKAAGNCLAMDLNTAAVFHLMRAVELVMRSIAKHLGVVAIKSKTIEQAGWDEIIRQIRAKLKIRLDKHNKRKKKTRSDLDAIRKLDALADDLNVFKEIWRNNVMHTRDNYDDKEALGVFSRVMNFTKRAANEIPSI